jgi:hypothetical protein
MQIWRRDRGDFVRAAREKRRLDDGHAVLLGAGRMALDDKAKFHPMQLYDIVTTSRSVRETSARSDKIRHLVSRYRPHKRPKRLKRSRQPTPSTNGGELKQGELSPVTLHPARYEGPTALPLTVPRCARARRPVTSESRI